MQVEALSHSHRFDILHLARRFFGTITAKPLTPGEQLLVSKRLRPEERPLFWGQSPPDRRHAFETMRRAATNTADLDVLRAALLHDVGKAESAIGAVARSIATVLDVVGLPMTGGMSAYRAHGELGAEALARVDATFLAVDFARRHPDPDPGEHSPDAWRILLDADDA